MSTVLNPYLGFRDNARQALEFHQSTPTRATGDSGLHVSDPTVGHRARAR